MTVWCPTGGHVLGWEHTFTHEVFDFLLAIAEGTEPQPSFADGYDAQCVPGPDHRPSHSTPQRRPYDS